MPSEGLLDAFPALLENLDRVSCNVGRHNPASQFSVPRTRIGRGPSRGTFTQNPMYDDESPASSHLLLALSKIPRTCHSILLRSHSTPPGRHVEVGCADVRILHPRCSLLAVNRPPTTGLSAFPISAQTVCVLRPFRLWLWSETLFRHLRKRMFTSYRWGPGEGGVRGERRGMAGTPRSRAVSVFDGNEIAALLLL
jgi:hypothetical protein